MNRRKINKSRNSPVIHVLPTNSDDCQHWVWIRLADQRPGMVSRAAWHSLVITYEKLKFCIPLIIPLIKTERQ